MPITEELRNIKKFESVGFTHEQAEVLTESIEEAVTNGHERLKDFIHQEINGLRNELKQEINGLRNELKAEIAVSSKDLLVKIFGIIVGTVGVAVTILKLFP